MAVLGDLLSRLMRIVLLRIFLFAHILSSIELSHRHFTELWSSARRATARWRFPDRILVSGWSKDALFGGIQWEILSLMHAAACQARARSDQGSVRAAGVVSSLIRNTGIKGACSGYAGHAGPDGLHCLHPYAQELDMRAFANHFQNLSAGNFMTLCVSCYGCQGIGNLRECGERYLYDDILGESVKSHAGIAGNECAGNVAKYQDSLKGSISINQPVIFLTQGCQACQGDYSVIYLLTASSLRGRKELMSKPDHWIYQVKVVFVQCAQHFSSTGWPV
eukprot:1154369-Pelagomonas_calceolata.AAC.2